LESFAGEALETQMNADIAQMNVPQMQFSLYFARLTLFSRGTFICVLLSAFICVPPF